MSDIVIVSAARTPVGSFNGALSSLTGAQLGTIALKAAMERAKVEAGEVDEVILGQILTAGQGQNPARIAAINAGIPNTSPAWGMNQLCGSGLRAVALAMQQIADGSAKIVAAGGQESMSKAPHVAHLRDGVKMGDFQMIDTMIKDGLWDAFNGYHMGTTAENVASKWQITRDMQDSFADVVVSDDEYIKKGVTVDGIAKLKPAFQKDGTVTAANASGINDGAAVVILMSAKEAEKRGLTPLARIVSWASVGVDPAIMGSGPIPASRAALAKAGWKPEHLDLVEANEAFAAQACAVNKDMGWDPAKVNVNGGAIAIGHPVGASGARVLNTLLFEMQRSKAKKGLATLCIGGGMGVAMCVER
jgi:acetyl-CoA C-acetyltransferase